MLVFSFYLNRIHALHKVNFLYPEIIIFEKGVYTFAYEMFTVFFFHLLATTLELRYSEHLKTPHREGEITKGLRGLGTVCKSV